MVRVYSVYMMRRAVAMVILALVMVTGQAARPVIITRDEIAREA